MNRIWRFSILIISIILLDQFTKGAVQSNLIFGEVVPVINGFFNITHVKNTGAAFGFMAGSSEIIRIILFLIVPVLACAWLAWLIWWVRHQSLLLGIAYSMILAGAIGNLIDRFSMGYVVDFLDFYYDTHHFANFNVADSSITIAAGLLIFDFFVQMKKEAPTKDTV